MKTYIYDSLMDLMSFAESLGWGDTYPDAFDEDFDDYVVDAIEEECCDFVKQSGYSYVVSGA